MSGLSFGIGIKLCSNVVAQLPLTYLAANTNTLPETAVAGTLAATLSIVGDDYVAPAIYTITSDPSGFFEIVGDERRVKFGAVFDYETTSSYSVTIDGMDGVPNIYSKTLHISISNVNEPPTAISLSATSISEDATIGDVIATISSSGDPDSGATVTYSIAPGGDPENKFAVVGNEIRLNGALNYAIATSHNVTLRVSDGSLTYDEPFVIDVTQASAGDYTANAVEFVDTSNTMTGVSSAGVSNTKNFMFSVWIYSATGAPSQRMLFQLHNNNSKYLFLLGGALYLKLPSVDGILINNLNAPLPYDQYNHIAICGVTDGSTPVSIFINGVQQASVTSSSDAVIDWTSSGELSVLSTGSGDASWLFQGYISDYYWNTDEYLNLSIPANMAKFSQGGKPVDLGADGSLPTGNQPAIFLKNSASTFGTNSGYLGDYIVGGTLSDAPSSPSD